MSLDFVKNHLLFWVGCFVSLFIIAESVFFLVKAWRRGKAIGISAAKLRQAVKTSAIFSIVPSLAILLTVVTLAKALGLNLPWIRLTVIGAITYELPAAQAAANAYGMGIGSAITDPTVFSTIAWVMTLGCLIPLILIPLVLEKLQGGINKLQQRDKHWGELFMASLFIGMISAFIGAGIAGSESDGVVYGSLMSILTLATSALIMIVIAFFIYKRGQKWLENFALPFSMIGAMAASILYWNILPEAVRSWRIPGLL